VTAPAAALVRHNSYGGEWRNASVGGVSVESYYSPSGLDPGIDLAPQPNALETLEREQIFRELDLTPRNGRKRPRCENSLKTRTSGEAAVLHEEHHLSANRGRCPPNWLARRKEAELHRSDLLGVCFKVDLLAELVVSGLAVVPTATPEAGEWPIEAARPIMITGTPGPEVCSKAYRVWPGNAAACGRRWVLCVVVIRSLTRGPGPLLRDHVPGGRGLRGVPMLKQPNGPRPARSPPVLSRSATTQLERAAARLAGLPAPSPNLSGPAGPEPGYTRPTGTKWHRIHGRYAGRPWSMNGPRQRPATESVRAGRTARSEVTRVNITDAGPQGPPALKADRS